MTDRANQRVAYYNGDYLPEDEVRIPFRDRSFIFGDGCFDLTRTFNGVPFKVDAHMERLYRSLAYLRIDTGLSPAQMTEITLEVLRRNAHLLGDGEDYWLGQRISRGVFAVGEDAWGHEGSTVIVECMPLPFRQRAPLFRDGITVIVPSVRRSPPDALSPRAKTHSYLNLILADMEARAQKPDAWAVLLDMNGNLCEGMGSNIFLVKDGRLRTPRERYVLPGISRQTVIELAGELGVEVEEADLDLYDAAIADEAFVTSTSLCICPVSSIGGAQIGGGKVPGPVTKRLLNAYSELVGCDIAGQYLRHLE